MTRRAISGRPWRGEGALAGALARAHRAAAASKRELSITRADVAVAVAAGVADRCRDRQILLATS